MATGGDPFADLLTLQRDMDRIMTRFGAQPRHAGEDGQNAWIPAVDVFKQGEDMVVRVEVPGVNPSDINVSVTGNMLTIKGERRQDQSRGEGDFVMRESTYGSFERRITMPEDIDAGQVHAQYRAGILEIMVPGSALVTARPQPIQVGGTQPQPMGGQPQYGQQPGQYPQGQQPGQYRQGEQQPRDEYAEELARYGRGPQAGEAPRPSGQERQEPQAQTGQTGTTPSDQQSPVEVQGGWVVPQQQAAQGQQQPAAGEQAQRPEEQPQRPGEQPSEETKRRSRLGEWFHGEER